MFLSFEKLLV